MSFWSQKFQAHEIWGLVASARKSMNEIDLDPADTGAVDAIAYSGQVLEHLEERRARTEEFLVSPQMLNNLVPPVTAWKDQLGQVAVGNQKIEGSVPLAEGVVTALSAWPPLRPKNMYGGYEAALRALEDKVRQALASLTKQFVAVDKRASDLDAKVDAVGVRIDDEQARISEAVADFKTSASQAVDDWTEESDKKRDALASKWKASQDSSEEAARAALEKVQGHEEAAGKARNAVMRRLVADDYGKYARSKARSAWVYDIAAFIVGAAGVGTLIYLVVDGEINADDSVGLQLMRVAISGGAIALATLIGRRGAQQHREARAAKRTDLALTLIHPFVANLEGDVQDKFVRDLTKRIFIEDKLDPVVSTSGIFTQLRRPQNDVSAGQE